MNLKRLLLLSALLMLCVRSASGQPTCSSYFDPFEACSHHYLNSEYVFLGRVVSVEKIPSQMEGYSNHWLKATVAVETSIKGLVDREVELKLDGRCYGYVSENRKYIFTANSEVAGLVSHKWSTALDESPPEKLAKLLNKIREVLQGVPEPRLFGTVTEVGPEFGRPTRSSIQAQPLAGIVVVVEDSEGNQGKTQTDAEGNYQFDELAVGTYTVYPNLPQKMDLYANSSLLQDGGKQSVEIDNKLCGVSVYFAGQQTGNITGRIERETGDWKSRPSLSLFRTGSEAGEFNIHDELPSLSEAYVMPSYMRPGTGAGTEFEFGFDRVPIGSYVLHYSLDPQGNAPELFYPLALSHHYAKLIKVESGKRTDLSIKVPFFQQRRIFGRVTLPDGTSVPATIRL